MDVANGDYYRPDFFLESIDEIEFKNPFDWRVDLIPERKTFNSRKSFIFSHSSIFSTLFYNSSSSPLEELGRKKGKDEREWRDCCLCREDFQRTRGKRETAVAF